MRPQLLCLIACLAGCRSGDVPPELSARTDSSGVRIVSYSGPDRLLQYSASRVFELGGEASGPQSFYQVSPWHLSISRQGRIAVLNRQASEVSVFDADGRHLTTLGREGEGPGEFVYPSSVVAEPDGGISVYDYRKRALVRFGPDGDVLAQQQLSVPFNGVGMVAAQDGLILLSQNAPRGSGELTRRVLHLSESDTVPLGPPLTSTVSSITYESCSVMMTLPPLFASDLVWASNGDRTVVAHGPDYSILIFDGTELVSIVRRDLDPEIVSEAVLHRELGEGEPWDIGGRPCLVPVDEVVEQRGHAEVVPLVEALALAPSGEMWVRRRVAGSSDRRVDVLSRDGEYLGSPAADVPFPTTFLPDGRIAVIEKDGFDIERVVVYRVVFSHDRE